MRHPTWIRPLPVTGLVLLVLTSCGTNATAPQPVDHSLAGVLQRTLKAHHLPALAGAVVVVETTNAKLRLFRVPDLLSAAFILATLALLSTFLFQ